jgi:GT2 family glycosyltransferase
MAPARKVSVLIPVWNGREHLGMVLSSLRAQTTDDFDVTVVDNASTDGTLAYLEEEWPEVRAVPLPENLGYAGGAARGIEATSGEHVAFLNDDMELEPDWIERLVAELDEDPGLGVVTSKVMFHGDRRLIYQTGYEYYVYGWCATRGVHEPDEGQYDVRLPSVGGTGAGSIYRRAALERAGGIDGDYFMYCEEVDVGLRLLMAGYKGLYIPSPLAFHVAGAKTGRTPDLQRRLFYRNQLVTWVKDVPWSILWRAAPKALLYLHHQYAVERANETPRVALGAYAEFLSMLPATLRKRRHGMRKRAISVPELRSMMRADYPFPTRFKRLAGAGN